MAQVRDNDHRPPYVQIADDIRSQIQSGALNPGDRVPSVRLLAEEYGVAPMTIWQAVRILKAENLLVSWRGRGIFVSDGTQLADVDVVDDEPDIIDRLDGIIDRLATLEQRVVVLESKRTQGGQRARSTD